MHERLDICRAWGIVDHNGGLIVVSGLEFVDGRYVLVKGECVLVLHDGIGIVEELCRCNSARVEDDRRDCRRYFGVRIICGSLVICIHGACCSVEDFVKEDSVNGNIGPGVCSPSGIDVDLGGKGGIRDPSVVGGDVAKGGNIGIAVELGEAGDIVCVRWICAWA